jgi:hypothetical protein
VDYFLKVIGIGEDGFELNVPADAETCFDPATMPAGTNVYVGASREIISGPFALSTLGSCGANLSVAEVSAQENTASGVATVTITLSSAASGSVFVDYATSGGSATAGADYTETSGTAEIADGNTSTTFDIPLLDDSLLEGNETLTVTLSNPQGALLDQSTATVTIVDDEGTFCGPPSYDPATEPGLFLWRDCAAPGPDRVWQVRVTGGGSGTSLKYRGSVSSTTATLGVIGYSIESNDELDTTPGDGFVDYFLKVIGIGEDGFELNVPADADACFDPFNMPSGVEVYLGTARQVMTGPFDLATLEACTP